MLFNVFSSRGRGIFALRGDEKVKELTLAAGTVISSYDAYTAPRVESLGAASDPGHNGGSAVHYKTDNPGQYGAHFDTSM